MRTSRIFGLAALIPLTAGGCGAWSSPPVGAIVVVVEDVLQRLEQPTKVYLGADQVADETLTRARAMLVQQSQSDIRTPGDRASAGPGAGIALGRFRLGADGRVRVIANFADEHARSRGCIEYVLQRVEEEWSVAETLDAWPDCGIATFGEEDYHSKIARIRNGDCLSWGAGIGTCGPWLYISESSGYHGTKSYYDPTTGLIAAHESFTDVDEGEDSFSFGHVECNPSITETIPCNPDGNPTGQTCGGLLGIPCDEGEFCKLPPDGCCCDFQGECRPMPELCLQLWAPVCGCDGRTYSNECHADAAGVSLDYAGECR